MAYLMESPSEADRLLKKSDYESSKQQLLLTGLKAGVTAVDAGGDLPAVDVPQVPLPAAAGVLQHAAGRC